MSFEGIVKDGKVEFDGPAPFADGTPVRVETVTRAEPPPDDIPPLRERLKNVLGKAVELPQDAASNHDKYIRAYNRP